MNEVGKKTSLSRFCFLPFFFLTATLSPLFLLSQDAPLFPICRRSRCRDPRSRCLVSAFPRGARRSPQEGRGGRASGLLFLARVTGARPLRREQNLRRRYAHSLAGRRGERRRQGCAAAGGARRVEERAAACGLDARQGCAFRFFIFVTDAARENFSFFREKKTDLSKKQYGKTTTEAAIARELASGKTWFSSSPDSRGRPYILSPSNRHLRAERDLNASRLALVYAMDSAAKLADAAKAKGKGDGRVVSVIDARGLGLANLDPEVSKLVVEVAQVRK